MSFQLQQGQILSPPYPFSGTLDIQQTQILERLKQLRVWQTQQQDHLLKQQQLKLQTEQEVITSNTDVNKQNKNTKQRKEILQQMVGTLVGDNTGPFSPQLAVPFSGNLQPQGHTTSGSSLHSTDSGMLTGQSSAVDVKDKLTNNNVDHYDDSSGILTPESHGYNDTEEHPPLVHTIPHDEIPVNPGIGPGSAATFEELLERKLQLYQANPSVSIATTHFSHCPSEESFVVRGNERQQTEEAELQEFELLEHVAAQDVSFSSQCSLVARVLNNDVIASSPSTNKGNISKCNERLLSLSPVNEILSDQPLQTNADYQSQSQTYSQSNAQVYSQSHIHPQSHSQIYSQSNAQVYSQSHIHPQSHSQIYSQSNAQVYSQSHIHPQSHSQIYSQSNAQVYSQSHIHPQSHSQIYSQSNAQVYSQSHIHPQSHSQIYSQSNAQVYSQSHIHPQFNSQIHPHSQFNSQSHSYTPQIYSKPVSSLPSLEENEEFEEDELDSTLKQDQTKFNDEEEWDSFIEQQHQSDSDNGVDNVIMDNEQMIRNIPVRKVCIMSECNQGVVNQGSTPLFVNPMINVKPNRLLNDGSHESRGTSSTCVNPNPPVTMGNHGDQLYNPEYPPPSALVAKLFPSLRKERQVYKSKYIQALQLPNNVTRQKPHPVAMETLPSPPTDHSAISGDTSGLSEQVKQKLIELENEINRFKKENTALDNLRREREDLVSKLKSEIFEFEQQKEIQLNEFEQYKMEEMKKLKKERKIFESFQKEANAVKDKKMKDELICLKQELEEIHEELKTKESRWSSSLSRYRLRIDSLESQNNELQNDLKVVEEQRLLWWQQQLEAKRSPTTNIPKRTRPLSTIYNGSYCTDNSRDSMMTKQTLPLKDDRLKQRRKSDPPLKNRNLGKENKRPNIIHSSTPSLNMSNKMDDSKKIKNETVRSGGRSKVPQNLTRPQEPCIPLGDNGNSNHDDECEVIEIKGCEYYKEDSSDSNHGDSSDGDISDQAEDIVSKILEHTETERSNQERPSVRMNDTQSQVKSVRFVNISSSSDEPSPRIEPPHSITNYTRPTDPPSTLQSNLSIEHHTNNGHNDRAVPSTEHTCTNVLAKKPSENDNNHSEEHIEEDGSRVVLFPNGTKKMLSADGMSSTVYFFNGDIKRIQSDGTIVYVYSQCRTTHKTFSDGKEIVEFSNGQTETRYPNGDKVIEFTDGTVRHMYPNGEEKVLFANGTVQYIHSNGDKTIQFTDGQKEIHTKNYKQREYPDGTIKTVYPDGRQETRYSNGRIRIKDKEGHVLMDNNNNNNALSSNNSQNNDR